MNSQDYGKIISKNLRRIASDNGKSQSDISRDLKINKATVSSWMNGTRVPRMSKIDLLTQYFNCTRADIMEPYKPVYFNLGSRSFSDLLNVLRTIEPRLEFSDESKQLIEFAIKFGRLPENDREEIMALIDLKLNRHKEKEGQNLA